MSGCWGASRLRFGGSAGCPRERSCDCDAATTERSRVTEPDAGGAEPDEPDAAEFGFVYMLKSGRYYKIGKTLDTGRRRYDLAIQLPEPVTEVHKIKTDDPGGSRATGTAGSRIDARTASGSS